jgi:hypothetical protein
MIDRHLETGRSRFIHGIARHASSSQEEKMFAQSSEELERLIETQSHDKDANMEVLVRKYKEFYNDKPVMRLIQDISQRSKLYNNLLEEIKRIPPDTEAPDWEANKIRSSMNSSVSYPAVICRTRRSKISHAT